MFEKITRVFILIAVLSCCCSGCTEDIKTDVNSTADSQLKDILTKLQQANASMKSFSCRIEYIFSQPLFESQTLRSGKIYYQRSGSISKLRMRFDTVKQDDQPVAAAVEDYYFDGVWLTRIEHRLKKVTKQQLADVNEPVDAFELLSRNFPIIGFSDIEGLERDFKIDHAEDKADPALHLRLEPVKGSRYFQDYTVIDFWIDREKFIPVRITAYSTQEDIYEIRLNEPMTNKEIAEDVFDIDIPSGFSEPEVFPLEKTGK